MAPIKKTAVQKHQWVFAKQQLVDVATLLPAQIPAVRDLEKQQLLLCATCKTPVRLIIAEQGPPWVEHILPTQHEVEDKHLRGLKRDLGLRLTQLFPNADVAMDVMLGQRLADLAVITGSGGRMVIEVQNEENTAQEIQDVVDEYVREALVQLWVMDGRRLKMQKAKKGMPKDIRRVTLGAVETGLTAKDQTLVYLDERGTVTLVRPPRAASHLAKLGDKKLGAVDCLVRQYKLSQLRINAGQWQFQAVHEAKMPAPPVLPAAAQKRLDKLVEKQQQQKNLLQNL